MDYTLVVVEWEDIVSDSSWMDDKEIEKLEPVVCRSVGWLLKKTKKLVFLGASVTNDGSVGDRTTIPKNVIRSIKEIPYEF